MSRYPDESGPCPKAPGLMAGTARDQEYRQLLQFMYGVRDALGMNDKCGLSGLANDVAEVRRIALRLRSALQFILAFYEPGQRHLDTEAWKRAEAQARAAVAEAQFPRLWDDAQ